MPQMIWNFHSMVIRFGIYEVPLAIDLISVQLRFVGETVEVFISFCFTETFIEIRVLLSTSSSTEDNQAVQTSECLDPV